MQVAAVAGREPRMLLKTISYISGGDRHDQTVGRARDVPERGSHRGQPRSLTVSGTADPQVSQSAGGGAAAPQTSQADSACSIPVSRSNTLRTTPTYGKRCRAVLDQRGIAARELTPSKDRRRLAGPDERNRRSACHKGGSMRPVLLRVILAVLASAALATTVLAVPAGASAPGSGWAKVPSPNPLAPTGQLFWVSCPGVSTCMAVGTYVDPSGTGVSLAERWDGARWSQLPIPNPPGAAVSTLLGLSCTSSSACIAVGAYIDSSGTFHAFAERWDGTTWRVQSIPEPPGAQGTFLNAVSCSSASSCTAVGNFTDSSGVGVTLTERWNGTTWAVQSTPNPSGAQSSGFSGVSCTSSTACIAVGLSTLGTLAEQWNGTAWTIQSTPSPGQSPSLLSVSCTSSSACIASGNYTDSSGAGVTLAEQWNGTKWTVKSTPNPPGSQFAFLNSVWCSSSSACTAVGASFDSSGAASTLAERWDGSKWTLQATSNVPGGRGGLLIGVACPGASACIAVGYGFDASGTLVTLGQGWDGTQWSVQPTANPEGSRGAQLMGVACISTSSCMSVGQSTGGTLAERWDGTAWRITPTPNPAGAAGSGLNGVSCTSPSTCIAVGTAFDSSGNPTGTITERWDGTTWSIQPTPTSGSPGSFLNAVSCTSPSACTAVGNTASGVLAERWDGTTWTVQSTPTPPGTQGDFFTGVSCTSPVACTAVGGAFDSSGNSVGTITERWDGTTWSIQPTPTSGSPGSFLGAVSCTSPSACTAVGNTASALLAERWDGATWTVQSTTNPPGTQGQGGFFSGVWCSSPSACTAVGLIFFSPSAPATVAERWDGSSWSVQD